MSDEEEREDGLSALDDSGASAGGDEDDYEAPESEGDVEDTLEEAEQQDTGGNRQAELADLEDEANM